MSRSTKHIVVWVVLSGSLFALFRWLFSLGIPGAALPFATGTTAIVTAGLLSGSYAAPVWYTTNRQRFNSLLVSLALLALVCLFLIGFLINKMIENTRFSHFIFTIIALFLANASVAGLVSLLRNRIKSNLRATQVALAQSKTELQVLQAQLSPHFLFNTLNNLYGFSLLEPQKVPELILKLSDLLRYSVYEVKDVFVPVVYEINYLKNYIDFEKIRLGERLALSLEMEAVSDTSITIVPMLLIVFIENAFKHSKDSEDTELFIHITLKTHQDLILFSVKNSCSPSVGLPAVTNPHTGFGLESVKKRLDLLYPHRHQLTSSKTAREYAVNLSLRYR